MQPCNQESKIAILGNNQDRMAQDIKDIRDDIIMSQLCTAQFITDIGFATGLTPPAPATTNASFLFNMV